MKKIIFVLLIAIQAQAQTFNFTCISGENFSNYVFLNFATTGCIKLPDNYCASAEITLGETLYAFVDNVTESRYQWGDSHYCVDDDPEQGRCSTPTTEWSEWTDHNAFNQFEYTPTETGLYSLAIQARTSYISITSYRLIHVISE